MTVEEELSVSIHQVYCYMAKKASLKSTTNGIAIKQNTLTINRLKKVINPTILYYNFVWSIFHKFASLQFF